MSFVRRNWRECLVGALILANFFVWLAVYERRSSETLSVYFLDIGQGDAILIESPSKGRVLIDGGRNRQVLSELGGILPFGDKRIDVVIATHPDSDHIGGLPEIISRFDVGVFLEPGVTADESINTELHTTLEARGIEVVEAKRGMVVNFGDGARLTILFPSQDVSWWPNNDASIVSKLSYGEHSFLLTGDAVLRTENIILNLGPEILDVDILQVGHHGSRTSTSLSFAEATSPLYAVISAGRDNSYGHPHTEVLQNLASVGATILGTYELGTIQFETDGETLEIR
jgi:competence protein ComEC